SIEDSFHKAEEVRDFFADFGIGLDHGREIFEMLLNVTRQFVSVVRTFSAGENRTMNTLRMTSNCGQRQMSAVADGPETDLVHAERLAQIFEIVGAFVGVVAG